MDHTWLLAFEVSLKVTPISTLAWYMDLYVKYTPMV